MDHYRTLQVTRDAEPEVIERAYKALSLKYHPDVNPGAGRSATRRMQRLNEAYAVLRDPRLRRDYDAGLAPEGSNGWDRFLDDGLIGLFRDRIAARTDV
ncbi:MAG: J domain-containing protein [Coriobacteriia bacterium]|nr:J domain-containing protein [Coriobacteriia bacterium]